MEFDGSTIEKVSENVFDTGFQGIELVSLFTCDQPFY